MINVFYVEKKIGFDVEARNILEDFRENLSIKNLSKVRVLNKYVVKGDVLSNIEGIIHEPTVDFLYKDIFDLNNNEIAFASEYLPGQYDQRADAASECFAILNNGERASFKTAKIIIVNNEISKEDFKKIKKYYINTVDSREIDYFNNDFDEDYIIPKTIDVINGFIEFSENDINEFHKKHCLAMSMEDLAIVKKYFNSEKRNPTITEIKVIDTYWSDHCRHTTFETSINNVEIEEGVFSDPIKQSFEKYSESRKFVYEDKNKDMSLMDIAVISMKEMRKRGLLDDLDVSDEINACSINVEIETDLGMEDYVLMFKNETHNHPTEIEPFGGAATCLGGAIRDPLSGRVYVYQAMRITGCADPTRPISDTLEGKLPQRTITLGAAHGYSSYGNQIGLATGEVREIYHDGYIAKRMEIGAVLGAAPKGNIVRKIPSEGDLIILLGGKTGRDGCGGATGSSKEHNEESIEVCGAEVQKGNPPTERKIQRLFRNKEVTRMIKRCNDFGAGGVSVAIGELCDSLDINLDLIPKKYAGLDGTEIAISESQERMAVVVNRNDVSRFIAISNSENLEATVVANVTSTGYMKMIWNGNTIVNLKREFLNTNGAKQNSDVKVISPREDFNYFKPKSNKKFDQRVFEILSDLNVSLQKGLVERFDSTIGAGTILMPFGGRYQLTPSEGMACKIPVLKGTSKHCSIMTSGFNPNIASWSPFHGAYYAVIESVAKIVAVGGDYKNIRLTLQEYFQKLGNSKENWGKPFAALLGAFKAQSDLMIPAIGGKDSMSGSFEDITVPPTLVSFAVTTERIKNIKSPEFKSLNSKILYLKVNRKEGGLLDINRFKNILDVIYRLNKNGAIKSISTVKHGGLIEIVSKMAIGNKIGFELSKNIDLESLFERNYGSVVIEVDETFEFNELSQIDYCILGRTINNKKIILGDSEFDIENIIAALNGRLESVFKIKTDNESLKIENISYKSCKKLKSKNQIKKPRVLIPVFPGTNCEYDARKAFEKAGADVQELVFNNIDKISLDESLKKLEVAIRNSQIVMLPGGFSAGDEPDGSAKFISTVFRNENIKLAIEDLLENRDGLMLGICNGFQALIKLGLVPYGKIVDLDKDMPTLTYNNIGRHMSSIIRTRIASNKSPWLSKVNVGDIHEIAISHGEGRFVANNEVIKNLIVNGQIATQYVDLEGNASSDMPFNPNGSVYSVEGITSMDGRVFGKMGHSERIGENLYKNIVGSFDQKIFEAGVEYFK